MNRILALDLSTRVGWAAWGPGESAPHWGAHPLPRTGEDVGRYLAAYRRWLSGRLGEVAPDRVVMEAPILPKTTALATTRKLHGLAGLTELIARDHGAAAMEVNNAQVRKHFIGRGRGKRDELKQATIAACRDRGWTPETDDEADALAVLDYAAHCLRLEVPWGAGPLTAGTWQQAGEPAARVVEGVRHGGGS